MEELANSKAPEKLILKQLVESLVNLDTLEAKAKSDPGKIVFDLPKVRQDAEKGLSEWQIALAEMTAEDRGDSDAGWRTLMGAIVAALSLASGGAAGVGALVLETATAGFSAYSLFEGIQDYRLADAAHMSDMDLSKALSAEEPSLFWLVFDIVTTVIGLKGQLVRMKEIVLEVQTAYKIAHATGETVA